MTHYVVLRHSFDISRNPTRLGGSHDEPFWLKLGPGSESPKHLTGCVLWLVSWEGTMKTRHMLNGWFVVDKVGKCNAVVAQNTACGHEGCLYPAPLGPLDMQPWFLAFVEANRNALRDGVPTELSAQLDDVLAYVRNAGCVVPPVAQGTAAG